MFKRDRWKCGKRSVTFFGITSQPDIASASAQAAASDQAVAQSFEPIDPQELEGFLSIVLVSLALTILVIAALVWARRFWSKGGRIFYSLLPILSLLLTWSQVYWHPLL